MSHPPSDGARSIPIRQWVGGALFFLGGIWSFLLFRDYYFRVLAIDATPNSASLFYQDFTAISAALAVLAVGIGFLLFMLGRRSRSRRHSHQHQRSKASAARSSARVPSGKPVSPNGAAASPDQGDAPPVAVQVDGTRTRRRIRVRVRKKKE